MKKAYYYLFYKFYRMSEAAPSRWLSDWKAGICIIALELWSVYSLVNYYNIFINRCFALNKTYVIITVLIICSINYFAFVHTDVWKEYVKEFDQLPKKKNRIGSWVVFGVVLFVIVNLIFSFYLMSQIDWSKYR